jgi:putative endonuclease
VAGRDRPRAHRQRLGALGEDRAADWYRAAGYEVIARNWRCAEGELDLVVALPGELVFCEVKTRTSDRFGVPAEAVTAAKQRRLRTLAARFLAEHPLPDAQGARSLRFDVVAVTGPAVDVIQAAF